MWTTYKFYDEKGRRLTIVGRVVCDAAIEQEDGTIKFENEQLDIQIVTCSKKDEFSKKAVKAFVKTLEEGGNGDNLGFKVLNITIPIKDNKPKFTFISWCQDTYYKNIPVIVAYNSYGIGRRDPGTNYSHVHSVLPGKKTLALITYGSLGTNPIKRSNNNDI